MPGSRPYLNRRAEPSGAAGSAEAAACPLSGGARGVGPRTAPPPSCAGPLRCGGGRRRSVRLSGAAASGEALGGRAAPLPSPPRCRPQRSLASPGRAGAPLSGERPAPRPAPPGLQGARSGAGGSAPLASRPGPPQGPEPR